MGDLTRKWVGKPLEHQSFFATHRLIWIKPLRYTKVPAIDRRTGLKNESVLIFFPRGILPAVLSRPSTPEAFKARD